ncbi:MAG TPA: hypothetical protein VLT33_26120 [Labilithrix sp.]|nr:hypothetical protein [Labilithrix sp.]
MKLSEIASFDAAHDQLSWPWLTFDASGQRFAFADASGRIASRRVEDGRVVEGPGFALPDGLSLAGVHGFSLAASGARLAVVGTIGGASVLVTVAEGGEQRRTGLDTLAGPGFTARATAFDRPGARLWISAESATETAILLVDAETHALAGLARSRPFPPPAMHEIHLHPQDDAILLLAACGEDGTFARVAGWSGGGVEAIATTLDEGGIPAGFVGFSGDVVRVHLAEADELRTHAWPGLEELSSVELADDFVSSYSGVVLGDRILVDGEDAETREDAVMLFDRSATRGALLPEPVPTGMWAGRLGSDLLVTVEAKGEPARGRVLRIG